MTIASAVPLTAVASRGTRKIIRRVVVANGGGKISFNFIAYVKSEKYYTTLLARSENLGAFMSLFSTP